MATNVLLAQPKISGEIRETALYTLPDPTASRCILLIGHSDAARQNEPYQVYSLKAAINWLNADSSSPLLRSLLEAWNAGCRNIYLYSVAPMNEYVANVADRNTVNQLKYQDATPPYPATPPSFELKYPALGGKTFYQKYWERLQAAYNVLKDYDIFQIIVPIEISLCETGLVVYPNDFLTQLAELCHNIFLNTSTIALGVIGTRAVAYDQKLFDDMIKLPALTAFGSPEPIGSAIGKNIIAVIGEGIMISSQMSRTYSASYAVQVGALLATVSLARSIHGVTFSNVAGLAGFELSEAQITQLTQAKLNPVVRTQRGKRGQSFETILLTDNSLSNAEAYDGYWTINQSRTVAECANRLKFLSRQYIGTNKRDIFKQDVEDYAIQLKRDRKVKDCSFHIDFPRETPYAARITATISPLFGIRNIYFTVETGPGS